MKWHPILPSWPTRNKKTHATRLGRVRPRKLKRQQGNPGHIVRLHFHNVLVVPNQRPLEEERLLTQHRNWVMLDMLRIPKSAFPASR